MALTSVREIPWQQLIAGRSVEFHSSPKSWEDQVLYFFLVDRFSDGKEDGFSDIAGNRVSGTTPLFNFSTDYGNATKTEADGKQWWERGGGWLGGTLQGAKSKLGYLKRLGITALWVSPVFKQVSFQNTYHGYGVQDFLQVDSNFGSTQDLVDLVIAAHQLGMYVVLDVILNHAGDVFAYAPDRYRKTDGTMDPRWDGSSYQIKGFRNAFGEPVLPFGQGAQVPVSMYPNDAIWPKELQYDGVFTCRGNITNWDFDPEFREGDFCSLKDIFHGRQQGDDYVPSQALQTLCEVMKYWIAIADIDGMRIDTVKHMDIGATRHFTSIIHEFAQSIGKDNFYLLGEVAGGRDFAFEVMEETGLDGALGIAHFGLLEAVVKGGANPKDYFDLFRNSRGVSKGSHAWFRDTVVTGFNDHDHIGRDKRRFCADKDGWIQILNAMALNALTLGIPCIYYGSEQGFDGEGGDDRALREAMFGGAYGSLESRGRHFFNERNWVYQATTEVLRIRAKKRALRQGRQYLRQISGDGQKFAYPSKIGTRLESIVAWSRLFASDPEILVAMNTDCKSPRSAWVTIEAEHPRPDPSQLSCLYSFDPVSAAAGNVASMLKPVSIQNRNGKAVQITLPPGGLAIFEG